MEENKTTNEQVTEEVNVSQYEQVATTACEHYLVSALGDPSSNMDCAQCSKCWHGVSYDPTALHLADGQLRSKE